MTNYHSITEQFVKPVYKTARYANYRKKIIREIGIRKKQNSLIQSEFDSNEKNLIVFLVPGADFFLGRDKISGGVLSIASLFEETKKLKNVHQSNCIMMTFPFEHLLQKHTQFDNEINVYRFTQLFSYFTSLQNLVIHIPELLVQFFYKMLSKSQHIFLGKIASVQINILNQNVRLMPNNEQINSLKQITKNVTITTAHAKYSTSDYRVKYGVPLHFFQLLQAPKIMYTPIMQPKKIYYYYLLITKKKTMN